MAHDLDMTIGAYMDEVTHPQHLGHVAFLRDQWNRSSKSDYYQMQLAMELRRSYVKHPARVKIEHFKVKFGFGRDEKLVDPVDVQKRSHAAWSGMMTMPITVLED